jgi:hypothetical protein
MYESTSNPLSLKSYQRLKLYLAHHLQSRFSRDC